MSGLVDAVFGGGDSQPPPDYTPVAQASKEAAEISVALGREQLAEAKRQYDTNMAVAQPVVNAQLQIMQQGINQGNDYNAYQKQFRPLEQAMLADISGISAADMERLNAMRSAATATSRTQWEQQQAARRTQLQQQLDAELARQPAAAAPAPAQSGPQFYIDAQGNVRTAEAFKDLKKLDGPTSPIMRALGANSYAGQKPGEGYEYYEYTAPEQYRNEGEGGVFTKLFGGANTGIWLKTQQTQQAVAQAEASGNSRLADQLRSELAALERAQFDPTNADMSAVDAEQQRLTMAGMEAKRAKDQAEIDAITGEARQNAGMLAQRTKAYEDEARADIALATGGNRGIADKFAQDIDYDVGRAVADARNGQTAALNTAARQAARYGISMPDNLQPLTNQNAATLAAAANNTRDNAINNYRNIVAQGIGLKQGAFTTGQAALTDAMGKAEGASRAGRDMRIQQNSLDWAKQLDVTGMARGMPGASQGAYGVAVSAGNSATQNQMAPGQALMGAMSQANQTQMQGRQMALGGLTSILGNQTSAYNNTSGGGGELLGTIIGAGAKLYTSDRRLKDDIELVGVDERTGLNLYEFSYEGEEDRFVGVMAQEVARSHPWAVIHNADGSMAVDYQALGLDMKEVA